MIVVGDRESDMWSLFERQARSRQRAGLLVRASRGRQRRVHDRQDNFLRPLFEHMDFLPTLVAGRKVEVDIQAGWLQRLPPKDRPDAQPCKVLAVRVLQTDEAEGGVAAGMAAAVQRGGTDPCMGRADRGVA